MLDLIQCLSHTNTQMGHSHKYSSSPDQNPQFFLLHNNQYLQVQTNKTQDLSQISLEIHNTNISPATLIVIHTQRVKKLKKSNTWNRKDRNLVVKVIRERQRCGK